MADRPQPGTRAMLAGDAPHLALEIHAILVEIRALRAGWERDAAEARHNADKFWATPGQEYETGTAEALERCAQALKALEDGHG